MAGARRIELPSQHRRCCILAAGRRALNLVQPSGIEPESLPSEDSALIPWTMAGWYAREDSNPGLIVRSDLSSPIGRRAH